MNCVNCENQTETPVALCYECYENIDELQGHGRLAVDPEYGPDEFWAAFIAAPNRPVWLDPMVEHDHAWVPTQEVKAVLAWCAGLPDWSSGRNTAIFKTW